MKLPKKKDIAVAILCVALPGGIIAGITYYFLKDMIKNVFTKKVIKKNKSKKVGKSTTGKSNRRLSRIR